MKQKVQIWITVTIDSSTEVLLLKTIPERGALWQPITGWVDSCESPNEAAKRELFEETSIQSEVISFSSPFEFEVDKPFYQGKVEEHVFKVELSSKPKVIIDASEHTEYQWTKLEKASDYLHFELQKQAIKDLK